jgi:hypothetical protein
MKRSKKEQKLIDLANKKSIHVSMTTGTHSLFRIACFKHKVSMQEAIEEFASLVANDNPDMISILEEIALRKLNKEIRKFDEIDTDNIYDILELENPLRNKESM